VLPKKEMMEAMGIATLVGGTIVVPHLRRAYEFWEALEKTPQNKDYFHKISAS
jgi:hypothetical protein